MTVFRQLFARALSVIPAVVGSLSAAQILDAIKKQAVGIGERFLSAPPHTAPHVVISEAVSPA